MLSAVLLACSICCSQTDDETTGRVAARSALAGRFSPRRPFQGRDGGTSWSMVGQMQATLEEFKHVPLLDKDITPLVKLQQERYALAVARQHAVSGQRADRPSDSELKAFHDLLRKDDELTSRQQELLQALSRDADAIQQQIGQRRQEIAQRLKELSKQPPSSTVSQEMRALSRANRAYDFVADRLANVQERPLAADWLRRFMHGMLSGDEPDPQMLDQFRRRLQQIEQDQEELRRKAAQLDQQIDEIQDLLEHARPAARPPRSTPPAR